MTAAPAFTIPIRKEPMPHIPSPSPTPIRTHRPGPPGVPNGPLARWLRHPGATQRHWLHQLTALVAGQAHHLAVTVLALAAVIVAVLVLRELGGRAAVRGGRWVEIRPPAQPAPTGGLALWRQLAPLLSARRTFTGARPPVGFECLARAGTLQLGLWVSRTISAAAVAHTVETAWPGAHATVTVPPPLLPARRDGGCRASGRLVRLSTAEWFPLGAHNAAEVDHPVTDPIRGLLGALIDVPAGGTGVLQILVRPATGRQLRHARRAALTARNGPPARTGRLPRPGASHRGQTQGAPDPLALADVREITRKLTDPPHFQVTIRLGVSGGPGRAGRRARRGWLRQLSAALGLYTGRNQLILGPLHRAGTTIGSRRLRRGFLLSVSELAALAHLPAEPSRHGLNIAAARAVAPPAELTDA